MSKRMLEQVGAAFTIPTNATDARDEADRRTAIIKQAQAERRALKSAADTMNKKPVSERRYRGFMETANEGLYPERYGD